MNITLSVDDRLVERVRELARRRGTSLNALIRDYFESLVGQRSREAVARELLHLMNTHGGHSSGRKIVREEAYESRL